MMRLRANLSASEKDMLYEQLEGLRISRPTKTGNTPQCIARFLYRGYVG
jgi:hypothetical protein